MECPVSATGHFSRAGAGPSRSLPKRSYSTDNYRLDSSYYVIRYNQELMSPDLISDEFAEPLALRLSAYKKMPAVKR